MKYQCKSDDNPIMVTIRSLSNKLPSLSELRDWESIITGNTDLRFVVSIHIDQMKKLMFDKQIKVVEQDGYSGYRCLRILMGYDKSTNCFPSDLNLADISDKLILIDWLNITVKGIEEKNKSESASNLNSDECSNDRNVLVKNIRELVNLLENPRVSSELEEVVEKHLWLDGPNIRYVIEAHGSPHPLVCFDGVRDDHLELTTFQTQYDSELTGDQILGLLSDSILIMGCLEGFYFPFIQNFRLKDYFDKALKSATAEKDNKGTLPELLRAIETEDFMFPLPALYDGESNYDDDVTKQSPTELLLKDYPNDSLKVGV